MTPSKDIVATVVITAFFVTLASILLAVLMNEDRGLGLARLFPDTETQLFWIMVVWGIGFVAFVVAIALAVYMGGEESRRSRS